jgi:hypothetical protein
MENPKFLDKKYSDLPGSKPVERAVIKARHDSERKFAPHTREERIQAYLDRIDRIVKDERGWELLKNKITKEFVIDTDDEDTLAKIAHGLYESEKKLAVEQGRGADVERLEQEDDIMGKYKGLVKEKRDIQERTLHSWLDYLQQNDAQYPTWFRYFVVRNLEKMGTLDKEKGEYTKRTDYTVAPFPELNSEALGFVYRMLTTGIGHQEFANEDEKQKKEELTKLIEKKDFIKLYTFAQIETAGQLNKESLQGEWVKYEQGSDHHVLEQSLRGKGTGWCTAEGSAYSHLQGGDFYVYYTRGTSGTYSEPRVAIRMEGDTVGEVRGVNHRQELEPALLDIAVQKYHSLPGGEKFDKKSHDMKKVTELVKKQEKNEQFTKDDLIFLYELDAPIEGFGYEKDPRIAELRDARNTNADLPIFFDCAPENIAHSVSEISDRTKAYVGKLEPGIFDALPRTVEHMYTKFPEEQIRFREIELGTGFIDGPAFQKAIEAQGMKVYKPYAQDMLENPEFNVLGEHKNAELVEVSVASLGFERQTRYDQICARALELGLEICPAEVGPQLRLQYADQPLYEYLIVAMKAISGSDGSPLVFHVNRRGDGLWLNAARGGPGDEWAPEHRFVFLHPRKN